MCRRLFRRYALPAFILTATIAGALTGSADLIPFATRLRSNP
jgi:hypothetical protein